MKLLNKFVERSARRLGIIVMPEWRIVRADEERHLSKMLDYLNVDCVFDVGANVGQYGEMLRQNVGYTGRIISFEPNPKAFDQLRKASAGDGLWNIENIALGASQGLAQFQAYDSSVLGSFRSFGASEYAPQNMGVMTYPVEMQTLASYLPALKEQYGFSRPFLKLDTQGFDLEVAKGAGCKITDFLGVQTEVAFQNIYRDAPTFDESVSFFTQRGFTLSRLVPIQTITSRTWWRWTHCSCRSKGLVNKWHHRRSKSRFTFFRWREPGRDANPSARTSISWAFNIIS